MAAAAALTAPKQYFKGVVKQVMDGGAVVIRGPPRNGPPAERIMALNVNVALKLVEEGLAKVRDNCQDKPLQYAQEQAKVAKKGVWGEGLTDHVRKITWKVDNTRALMGKFGGKPVSAVVEQVCDGTTLRLFLLPDMVHVTLMMCGVRAPGTRLGPGGRPDPAQCEPFATEAHYFTESRLLQREIEL